MHKILLVAILAAVFFGLYAIQLDQEAAVQTLFELKRAVNRAAHAAAQQVDIQQLSRGVISFDEPSARSAAMQYLQHNLRLDERLNASDRSSIRGRLDIRVFELIDSTYSFPYDYSNEAYDYSVTLERPGVIMIVHAEYNRMFKALEPIDWYIKGAAEIVR